MRGLYSGKLVRSRFKRAKSEYKHKVKISPNVLRKTFHSDVLERDITINITTETIRLIRKYGSFDNYILLHKPNQMVSMFGEYLKKIMLLKIN
jgi:large subunit ribosomal protein L28